MSKVPAKYNKQDGTLTLAAGAQRGIQWEPASGGAAQVTVAVRDITNLQQTPATAAKASIRVSAGDSNYTFQFTSATARDDQQAVTGTLRQWIEAEKASQGANTPATPAAPADNGRTQSAAMIMAQTAAARMAEDTYDDAKLMRDSDLQRSLLNSSPALRQRFDQAVRDKPESITIAQLATQFWATRVHLLRAHAAEKAQGPGTYNVLSVVKLQDNIDGTKRLDLTKEQIRLIFAQHPLVKRVYNENVPKIGEAEFWKSFIKSRLVKKLRGERITDMDPMDARFDKYLDMDDDDGQAPERASLTQTVPRFLDIAGNEQNHSQRQGNRPDWTMQPNSYDKVPILRTLNRMSEKMMAQVPSSDIDPHAPAGLDEETYKEIQLRDLQLRDEDNRVILKIRDQDQLFSAGQGLHTSTSAETYAQRTPADVLSSMRHEVQTISGAADGRQGLDLQAVIGVAEDSSSEEESQPKKKARVGGRGPRQVATAQILSAIRKRHLQNDDQLLAQGLISAEQASKLGLSVNVFDSLTMTHNTTVEFLNYFWAVYFSGDPDRANEVARLIETLDKSLDRIKAVADMAESERAVRIDQWKRELEAYAKRTGKRRRFDPESIKGGAKVVNKVMGPLVRAIGSAKEQFEAALHRQMRAEQLRPVATPA